MGSGRNRVAPGRRHAQSSSFDAARALAEAIGIDKKTSALAQKLADMPPECPVSCRVVWRQPSAPGMWGR